MEPNKISEHWDLGELPVLTTLCILSPTTVRRGTQRENNGSPMFDPCLYSTPSASRLGWCSSVSFSVISCNYEDSFFQEVLRALLEDYWACGWFCNTPNVQLVSEVRAHLETVPSNFAFAWTPRKLVWTLTIMNWSVGFFESL